MDEPGCVRAFERARYLLRDLDRSPQRQRPAFRNVISQAPAAAIFHSVMQDPILLAKVVESRDVGMREFRHRARLCEETLAHRGVGNVALGDNF